MVGVLACLPILFLFFDFPDLGGNHKHNWSCDANLTNVYMAWSIRTEVTQEECHGYYLDYVVGRDPATLNKNMSLGQFLARVSAIHSTVYIMIG